MAKQPPKTQRSWGKNIARSIAHVTKDVIAEVMPNSVSTVSSLTSSGKGVADSLSRSSQTMVRQINTMDRSAPSRKVKGMFKDAMTDIREGNLYYKNTANELSYMADSMDVESIEQPTDSAEDFSAAYSSTDSVRAITGLNTTMANTSSATITSIGRMSDIIASTQLKSAEAMSATIKNATIAQSNVISEGLNQIAQQIHISNQYSAAMLEFMNKNISPTNQSMLDIMPLIGQKLDQIASAVGGSGGGADRTFRPANDPMYSIISDGSGINFKNMLKHFKSNFENSGVGALVAMASMATGIGSGKGMGNVVKTTSRSVMPLLTKQLTKMLVGEDNLKRFGKLDETIHDAFKEALYSLGDLKDPVIRAKGGTNRLMSFLSDIFGVERPKMAKINLGGGRKDENMQWNAIAQKTLVDVIPGLLSSIDKTLSGSQYAQHYDYRTGKFMREDEIGKRYATETREVMDRAFETATTKILDSLTGSGIRFNDKDIDKILESINTQIDKRLSGEEGNTRAYKTEVRSILRANGVVDDSKLYNIMNLLEKGIRDVTDTMSAINHGITMGNHDYQSYRSLMGGSSKWGSDFANYNSTRSHGALNRGSYRSMMSEDPIGFHDMLFAEAPIGIIPTFLSDHRKAGKPRGPFKALGGAADLATASIQHMANKSNYDSALASQYQTASARTSMKSAERAEAINRRREKFSRFSKRNLDTFKIGSTDPTVLAQNIAIEEAYLSEQPVDIMQGLAQDIHSKLLVPMYGTFFSKKGILNKFFGDDPNSEFNKLKEKLFGEEGIFRPMKDWLKYKFTGKGYTAKDGTVYEDTEDNVFNKLKGSYGKVFDNTMLYLLGEDYKDQEIYQNVLHGLSVEGMAQRRARKRARKEIIKREGEAWAEQRASEKLADETIGKGYQNRSSVGYGFSQYDPRWANKHTGRFGDGRIATMATAGCGPVALANVANYLGYGSGGVDPMTTLELAKQHGYLSNGGATKELFTRGASRMGLGSKITDFIGGIKALKKGMPVIFAGKSNKKGSIYSKEGHIVTAYRTVGYGNGGVLVNDGDSDYIVPPEALMDGMTHAFAFTNKRGRSIGGELFNDDLARRYLRDEAKYDEDLINMVDYMHALGITDISYTELEKRIKKSQRKPSSKKSGSGTLASSTTSTKTHVYDGILFDIKSILEKVDLTLHALESEHKDTPGFLYGIKQMLDKKVPNMNQVFDGIGSAINAGFANLKWALDANSAEQQVSIDSIQDIITRITSDKADFADANIQAALASDIKDLTTTLTTFMQGIPQHTSYLQQQDYAEAKEIIGSITSDLAAVSANIGNISKPENLKSIVDLIAEMNSNQLKDAIATVLNPTQTNIDAATIFALSNAEAAAKSTYSREDREAELTEAFAALTEPETKETSKVSAEIKESANKVVENVKEQAKSVEKTTKTVETAEAIVGDLVEDPDSFKGKFISGYEKFKAKLKKNSTSHLHTAVLGAGVGLLNGMGGGLLTNLFLPGGPVGGAIMGLAGSIIGHSKTMEKILYGDDKDFEGITTREAVADMKAKFKKVMPYAVGGATLGVVKNVVGSLFGLSLGSAPGLIGKVLLGTGPMGAAIVGMSIGLLKNSDKMKELLFGKKADDNKHYGGKLSGALNTMSDIVKASSGYLKTGFKGAGMGALSGLALSSMGYLPAALAVGGPVGMAIAGLAIGISANTDRFKRYLFGTTDVDEEGNKKRNKDGLFHRVGQMIMQDAIYPMRDTITEKTMDFAIWARRNVELPFKIAFGPITDKFKDIKDDIKDIVKDSFDKVSKGVINIFKGGVEGALKPVTWAMRKGTDLATSALSWELKAMTKLAMSPISLLAAINKRKSHYKDLNADYRTKERQAIRATVAEKWQEEDDRGTWDNKSFGRIRRFGSHFFDAIGLGRYVDPEMAAQSRAGFGAGLKGPNQNKLGWFEAGAKVTNAESKYYANKQRREKYKKASELARKWSREDNYNESRKWTQDLIDERYNALRDLGFDDRAIRSEAELKKLMFHRGEWQKSWGKYGDEDLRVEEVKLQQETAVKTETYQETMTDYMKAIYDLMLGAGYQAGLNVTAGKRIGRDRAKRDEFFRKLVKSGIDISDYKDEFAMTREEYNVAKKHYESDLDAMRNMNRDERIAHCRATGLPVYLADMIDDNVKSKNDNISSFESFTRKTEKGSAEVRDAITKSVVYNIADEGLRSAAATAFNIDLSDEPSEARSSARDEKIENAKVKGTTAESDTSDLLKKLNAGVYSSDSKIVYKDGTNAGKVNVDKYLEVALQTGALDESQVAAISDSFTRSRVVSKKTMNSHLKTVLFEAMDAALDKNLDAYDAEQDREVEEAKEQEKEAKEQAHAEALGDEKLGEKKTPGGHGKLYNKLFYDEDGNARGGILGWAKKKADKISDNGLVKTLKAIISNPLGKIGLGLGAYLFSDQLIGLADVVSDVWQEHIPALWNFVSTTVVPTVISKVGDIASWCIQALPEIFTGVKNGLSILIKDIGRKLGLGNRDTVFTADQVDTSAGTSIYGDTLVQYIDPNTGEMTYVTDEDGNFMTRSEYQYLSSDGQIRNVDKGTPYDLTRLAVNSLADPKTFKRTLKLTGTAIRVPSAIGKHIPIVGGVFKATDGIGKGLTNIAKHVNTERTVGEAITSWAGDMRDKKAWNAWQAKNAKIKASAAYDTAKASKKATKEAAKAAKSAVYNAGESVARAADDVAEGTLKSMDKILAKLAGSKAKFRKILGENVASKWIDWVCKSFKSWGSHASSKVLGELGSKLALKAGKIIDDFIPFVNVAMTAYDAISGWCNAEYLFDVPSGEETGVMRLVSSAMNTLLGLGIGPLIDIMMTVFSSVVGHDIKKEIAQKCYVFLCELAGDEKALAKFKENQAILLAELDAYNAAHPTAELTLDEYQALKKKANSFGNKVKNVFGGGIKEDFSKYSATAAQVTTTTNTNIINMFIDKETDPKTMTDAVSAAVGNGAGEAVGYGYSQMDPRWSNYNLGKFANGELANMTLAGCGPTALANVATQMGVGVNPVQVATMAKRKGYLTDGGANEKLFDNGTTDLGLTSKRIGNGEIVSHLKSGHKIIISGKSTKIGYGDGSPYTPAGHILSIDGISGNKVIVTDPQNGYTTLMNLSALAPGMTHSWAIGANDNSRTKSTHNSDELVGYSSIDGSGGTLKDAWNTIKNLITGGRKFSAQVEATNPIHRLNNQGMAVIIAKEDPELYDATYGDIYDDKYYDTLTKSEYSRPYTPALVSKWMPDSTTNFKTQDDPKYRVFSKDIKNENWYNRWYGEFRGFFPHDRGLEYWEAEYTKYVDDDDRIRAMEFWNNLDIGSKLSTYTDWVTQAKPSYGGLDDALLRAVMEWEILPNYGMRYHHITSSDIENLHMMHGYLSDTSTYLVDNIKNYQTSKDGQTARDYQTILSKGGPNNIEAYYGLSYLDILRLSDPMYGGDPSIRDSWLYCYLCDSIEASKNNSLLNLPSVEFVKKTAYSNTNHPYYSMTLTPTTVQELAYKPLEAYALAQSLNIGTNDYEIGTNRPYGIVNGIPYYYQLDSRWADLPWKGGKFSNTGADIASLAMILSAYSSDGRDNRAITPQYILSEWLNDKHKSWHNVNGLTSTFFSKSGLQSLQDTFDASGAPLGLQKITTAEQALSAMKEHKLILMRGRIDKDRPVFGSTGSGMHTLVGTYANDSAFIVTDPKVKGKEIVLPTSYLKDVIDSGIVFTTGSGTGLGEVAERSFEYPAKTNSIWSQIVDSLKDSWLAPFVQTTKGIISIFTNLGKAIVGGKEYESIFKESYVDISDEAADSKYLSDYDYLSETGMNLNSGSPTTPIVRGPAYNQGIVGPIGGEYDFISSVTNRMNEYFDTTLGKTTTSISDNTDLDPELTNGAIVGTISSNGKLTNTGLKDFARQMKRLGTRYVWGGSCKQYTMAYMRSLIAGCADAKHDRNYYEDRYRNYDFKNKYVSDCSGLIRGYTGNMSMTANALYLAGTEKGPLSSLPRNEVGYLVFRQSKDKSKMEHVGITTGNGYVIHCNGYRQDLSSDVIEERINPGSWTHWCKCHLINYPTRYSSNGTPMGGENDSLPAKIRSAAFDVRQLGFDNGTGSNPIDYLTKSLGGYITQKVGYGVNSKGNLVRHRGTDIAANYGAPIHSPVSGKVVESRSANYGSAYGNYTVIQDNKGSKHLFAHMDRPTGYGVGSTVHSGDVIGNIGNSGLSTGPHLHYEVRNNDHIIDPLNHKTNLNIIESRFDESMKRTSSPTGGENDILSLANSLGATAHNTDEIVTVLKNIVEMLRVWQDVDEESKNAMLNALEESSGNVVSLGNLINATSNKSGPSAVNNNLMTSAEDPINKGGRALHDLIAKK